MIDLPNFAVPTSFAGTFIDAGFAQRAIQSADYVPRKGGRFRAAFTFGPYTANQGRVMIARLISGKQGGARIKLPLLHSQGSPGAPVVVAASGRTLELSGLTPGYVAKEGYWLSLVKSGQHFLHSLGASVMVDPAGEATFELNELLRDTFAPGTVVHLAEPQMEGLLEGDEWSWQYNVSRIIPIEFTIEEKR